MNNEFKTTSILLLFAVGLMIAVLPGPSPREQSAAPSNIILPNAELRDQNGAQVGFVSDVVGDRIIALSFIYSDCQTTCPVVSAIFSKLQSQLGRKLGQGVRMVSLSINPVTDTPERLKAYAERFHAEPEWIWLTGDKAQVDALLKGLGVYAADYAGHAPVILVGDLSRGVWARFNGLSSPKAMAAKIDELLTARNEKS